MKGSLRERPLKVVGVNPVSDCKTRRSIVHVSFSFHLITLIKKLCILMKIREVNSSQVQGKHLLKGREFYHVIVKVRNFVVYKFYLSRKTSPTWEKLKLTYSRDFRFDIKKNES